MAVDKKNREELAAEQARKEAELFVKGKSKEDIEKELKRMEKGPGFLGWVRDRINGFLNFVKIAALSVLLGRRETSRRMDAGTLEAEQKAREDAAAKLARQEVLREKLKELDPSKKTEKQEEASKDKEQNPNEQNKSDAKKNGQDQETGEEEEHSENRQQGSEEREDTEQKAKQDQEENKDAENGPKQDNPSQEHQETSDKSDKKQPEAEKQPKNETILAQQCREMTDGYREGLTAYIENVTGIKRDYFTVGNADGKIRIDFGKLNDNIKGKDNPYRYGVTLDKYGCIQEHKKSDISKMLGTVILYYTAEIYKDSRNKNRFQGTVPSKDMLPAVIKKLQDKIEENQRNGGPAKNFSQPLYGHVLTVGMTGRGENRQMFVSIDGEKGQTGKLEDLAKWAKATIDQKIEGRQEEVRQTFETGGKDYSYVEIDNHNGGDYGQIPKYREAFYLQRDEMVKERVMPVECAKYYTIDELKQEFNKQLHDIITDGQQITDKNAEKTLNTVRGFEFGNAHYHIEFEPVKNEDGKDDLKIKGVLMTSAAQSISEEKLNIRHIYGEINGIDAKRGYNELNENIAKYMAEDYAELHQEPKIEDRTQENNQEWIEVSFDDSSNRDAPSNTEIFLESMDDVDYEDR